MSKALRIAATCMIVMLLTCIACSCGKEETPANVPSAAVGDVIAFGSYEQDNNSENGVDPIEWIVLDKQGDKALLITKQIVDAYWYNHQETLVTWEKCELRAWLNGDFYKNAFSGDEQKLMIKRDIETKSASQMDLSTRTDKQLDGCKTNDYVYILTIEEIEQYLPSVKDRTVEPTKTVTWRTSDGASWWTRSPGTIVGSQRFVEPSGSYGSGGAIDSMVLGVRPVIWIKCK